MPHWQFWKLGMAHWALNNLGLVLLRKELLLSIVSPRLLTAHHSVSQGKARPLCQDLPAACPLAV